MPDNYYNIFFGGNYLGQQCQQYQWGAGQVIPAQVPNAQAIAEQIIAIPHAQSIVVPPLVPAIEIDEEGDMLNDFKVGCDPEFLMLGAGNVPIRVDKYFPHNGPIGYDHGGRVAEFRPKPARGVYLVLKNIQTLLKSTALKNIPAKLRAGAIHNGECLGGHIHFGFNCFAVKPNDGQGSLSSGQFNPKGAKVVKAMDTLTKSLEKLDILPLNESDKRRESAQGTGNYYGHYGDVRDCKGHMEYRTMASWLYDPKVALLCLTAAKIAAVDPERTVECLKNYNSFKDLSNWLDAYKFKDINVSRVSEKILAKGHKTVQVDPTVDFRERWEELGI